jgi:hypothetical protein
MTIKVTYHSDPGNGWFAVKLSDVVSAGLKDKISEFSYKRGKTVYLEEDHDAPQFFRAIDRSKLDIKYATFKERSPVRGYDPYAVDGND